MSTLSKDQRDKLPESAFGDPTRRLFPILDQNDVDSAASLIGKAKNPEAVKARIIAIAKRKGLKIPDAWQEKASHSTTLFAGRRVEGDYAIYPDSLLFKAGEYPDKAFTMTPEELYAAIEQFQPVSGNIEHTDYLQGKACEVRSIRFDETDSFTLLGEVAVPLWLDAHLEGHERRLSCEWDRDTKTLAGIALTVTPRVAEAALLSAFTDFAGKRHSAADIQDLQAIHDITVKQGAECPPQSAAMARRNTMSFMDKVKAWLDEGAPAEFDGEAPKTPATPDPRIAQLERERDEARQAALTANAARLATEAAAFADGEIAANRAFPAERDAIIAAFTQAATDDTVSGTANFTDGASRLSLFKAAYAARPAHRLTEERLPANQTVLANQQETEGNGQPKPMTPERKAALLSLSDLGRVVAKDAHFTR
jgi:hypothetical protein